MSPQNHFIDRMLSIFHAPISENENGFVEEMRKALAGWDLATLDAAADRLAKTAKFFPKPAEVIDVCEHIASSRVVNTTNPASNGPWSSAAFTDANRLIRSPMGQAAAKEGWIGQLHDFCREHRKAPNPSQIANLKAEARLFEQAYRDVCSGRGGTLGVALQKLGESFLENRNKLAAVAHGEKFAHGLSAASRRMQGDVE